MNNICAGTALSTQIRDVDDVYKCNDPKTLKDLSSMLKVGSQYQTIHWQYSQKSPWLWLCGVLVLEYWQNWHFLGSDRASSFDGGCQFAILTSVV